MNTNSQITVRRSAERGRADHGWLDARHTFSFAGYRDPDHMGFRALRVMNEDRIAGGGGFGEHPHNDMEIITVVIEGALEHRDSLGSGSVIRPGDIQVMTAGTGILHSEFNGSETETCHLLQIWILPERAGSEPRYDEKHFVAESAQGDLQGGPEERLRTMVSGDGRDGSLRIGRDVLLLRGTLRAGESASHALTEGRHGWVQVVSGSVSVLGTTLEAGDGAALSQADSIALLGVAEASDVLVFDLD
jgi:hypothetical protein